MIETLSRVIPVATRSLPAAPDADLLRAALRKQLNQGDYLSPLTDDEAKAITWLKRASRPVRSFEDDSVVCDVLDAWPSTSTAARPRRNTPPADAGSCTRRSATRYARSAWTRTP
jgi:hypothetical protein